MKGKLVIIGGANGVGKTTFAYQYKEEYGIDYLGADEIAREMSESEKGNVELRAGKEFFRRLSGFVKNKKSVIVESTLSGRGLEKKILEFKENGFAIHIVYVFLGSTELCKKRVKIRVRKGGHNVPKEEIERRYKRSLKNFKNIYLPLAHTWQILYNSFNRPVEVAAGENGTTMILDEDYYRKFQEISN